jgi:hypothetical protein
MPALVTIELPPPSDWNEFEDICADLFALTWNDQNTVRYGRQGQRQNGVDIRGRVAEGPIAGVQCKGKRQWPPAKLTTREIDKQVAAALNFSPPLGQFTIATTASNDAPLQSHADAITERHREKGLFSVHILGWTELSRRIKNHDQLIEKYYPFITLSSVRAEIAEMPERTVRLLTEHLREIGVVSASSSSGGDALGRPFDAMRSGLIDAVDRDFNRRYRRAMQRSLFPECAKVNELHSLAKEIEEGDYLALSPAIRRTIFLRAARSTALRNQLQESERLFAAALPLAGPEPELPAAARIAEARGDAAGAIRMLRDQADDDCRSVRRAGAQSGR